MEDEFSRADTWKDWQDVEYSAREEYAYVCGPAVRHRRAAAHAAWHADAARKT